MIPFLPFLRGAAVSLLFVLSSLSAQAEPSAVEASAVAAVSAGLESETVSIHPAALVLSAGEAKGQPAPAAPQEEKDVLTAEEAEVPVLPASPEPMEQERYGEVREDALPLFTALTLSAEEEQGKADLEAGASRLADFVSFDRTAFLRRGGALWLYLALESADEAAPHTLWLDLGRQIPATRLWLSPDGFHWEEEEAFRKGLYSLRKAGAEGHILIRMDGQPGLWFSPVLRSFPMTDGVAEYGVSALLTALLALLAAVNLFLCLSERSEPRFWLFVLASAAAVQSVWPVPSAAFGIGAAALPGIFAAGIALVMFPHVGRVLMRTRFSAPGFDTFFLFLALPGACMALLPLIPGMSWTARLLALWPLAALACFFPAFVLLCRGLRGSGSFALASLCLGAGASVAFLGMDSGFQSWLWGLALPAGQVLGLLILTAVPSVTRPAAPKEVRSKQASSQIVPVKEGAFKENSLAALRRTLKSSVEELLDTSFRLDQALNRAGIAAEKQEIMEHADAMVATARRLAEKAMDSPAEEELPEESCALFELRSVIQSAFASVFGEAEKKGLGLAWYVAPHLGRRFKGDSVRLTALLSLLVSDAVRASSGGAVCVRVRRADMSTHPGHLLFTVSDSGDGKPPHGRSSRLLARVWDLASAHGGDMFVNSGPGGTDIGFSMMCEAYEDDGVTARAVPGQKKDGEKIVIAACSDSVIRQMIPHYLSGLGLSVWEARDAAEAAALYAASPAALMIFDGSLAEDDMAQAVAAVRMHEGENALPAAPFLLLAKDALQAERMAKAGCDESLLHPLLRKDLRAMARWLTSSDGGLPRPELAAQSVTLAALLAGADAGKLRLQRKRGLNAVRAESPGGDVEAVASVAVHQEEEPVAEAPAPEEGMPEKEDDPHLFETLSVEETNEESGETLPPVSEEAPAAPEQRVDEGRHGGAGEALADEPVEEPVVKVLRLLDELEAALTCLDSPAIRRDCAALAAHAEAHGMRMLSDMALGAASAWEEADVEAAVQIVADMRAEAARM